MAWRAALLAVFAIWGLRLIAADLREGAIFESFLHGPLLLFHEGGHVLLRPLGEWMSVAGGTLMQLALPAAALVALLRRGDRFGAALALWLVGVSVLDVAPYVYDARDPQLMLLTGATGEEGGHDWIFLLDSMGLRSQARLLGLLVHRVGALVVLAALGWAAWELHRRWRQPREDRPTD